ncbi:MAG: choline-phosphate cytidylyltransferase [Amphiamblys sp. WSBS2006]|nr:MAG: choline-phosphate cytidylyltransferase [Amphiamblys sp. WSBS2006]
MAPIRFEENIETSREQKRVAANTKKSARIYCDGVFDMFHYGHARVFEQVKKKFPKGVLIVGVCNKKTTHENKGKTLMTSEERYESVRHCRWVDEVVKDAPWILDEGFIKKHRIDIVAHDPEPYKTPTAEDVYACVKQTGRFFPTKRTKNISTTKLITRILKDYDGFLLRSLKRGVTGKELRISFAKEKGLLFRLSIERLKTNMKKREERVLEKLGELKDNVKEKIHLWEEKSQEIIQSFISLFGV